MQTVAHLVEPAKLQARAASVDAFAAGEAIANAHGVMLELTNPLKVTAKVTTPGGTVQRTELASAPDGLQWHCSCSEQSFCAHLIATAITVANAMPKHHRNPKADQSPMV